MEHITNSFDHKKAAVSDDIRLIGELCHIRAHALRSAVVAEGTDEEMFYLLTAQRAKELRRQFMQEHYPNIDSKLWCLCKSAACLRQVAYEVWGEKAEFLKQLEKGTIDFDVLISTPQYMPKLGKFARLLGPKGLMPNPKAGTVTMDVEKAVKEAKAGKVEYRVDKQAIVHIGVGKVSFGVDKLMENANAFFDSLKAQKPASLKGTYVKSVFITTTMGPSISIENLYN